MCGRRCVTRPPSTSASPYMRNRQRDRLSSARQSSSQTQSAIMRSVCPLRARAYTGQRASDAQQSKAEDRYQTTTTQRDQKRKTATTLIPYHYHYHDHQDHNQKRKTATKQLPHNAIKTRKPPTKSERPLPHSKNWKPLPKREQTQRSIKHCTHKQTPK